MKGDLYIAAHATHEDSDSLGWCRIEAKDIPAFLAELKRLRAVVAEHKLQAVDVYFDADWGPESTAEEMRLQFGELKVCSDEFWMSVWPKYSARNETTGLRIDAFIESVEAGERYFPGELAYASPESIHALKDEVAEDEATAELLA